MFKFKIAARWLYIVEFYHTEKKAKKNKKSKQVKTIPKKKLEMCQKWIQMLRSLVDRQTDGWNQ